jgi:hypothetical protein
MSSTAGVSVTAARPRSRPSCGAESKAQGRVENLVYGWGDEGTRPSRLKQDRLSIQPLLKWFLWSAVIFRPTIWIDIEHGQLRLLYRRDGIVDGKTRFPLHKEVMSVAIFAFTALPNIGERQNSSRVQRCGGFAEAIAAGRRLIEDERKCFAKFANSAKRRQRCLDVGRTWPCWDQAHVGSANRAIDYGDAPRCG